MSRGSPSSASPLPPPAVTRWVPAAASGGGLAPPYVRPVAGPRSRQVAPWAGEEGRKTTDGTADRAAPQGIVEARQQPPADGWGADRQDMDARVADRLEALAARVRQEGLSALGNVPDQDELARLIGAVVAGFYHTEGR
jgi:hypothetical protein